MDRKRARKQLGISLKAAPLQADPIEAVPEDQVAWARPRELSPRLATTREKTLRGQPAARGPAPKAGGDDAPSQKVTRIRRALASGSYKVDAGDVADKLMDHMLRR